jgi:hypothetical protein
MGLAAAALARTAAVLALTAAALALTAATFALAAAAHTATASKPAGARPTADGPTASHATALQWSMLPATRGVAFLSAESPETIARTVNISLVDGGFAPEDEVHAYSQPSLSTVLAWQLASAQQPVGRAVSCAVVGSSSSLLEASEGEAIDKAEWVIRVNNAPAGPRCWKRGRDQGQVTVCDGEADRKHIGSRTTFYVNTFQDVRVLNATLHLRSSTRPAPRTWGEARVVYYCHVPWPSRCWDNAMSDGSQRLSPRLVAQAKRSMGLSRHRWPSTGSMAIMFALHHCHSVQIYGFDRTPAENLCAKYYAGSYRECNSFSYRFHKVRENPDKCFVYPTAHREHESACMSAKKYLRPTIQYHNWTAESQWLRKMHLSSTQDYE